MFPQQACGAERMCALSVLTKYQACGEFHVCMYMALLRMGLRNILLHAYKANNKFATQDGSLLALSHARMMMAAFVASFEWLVTDSLGQGVRGGGSGRDWRAA